MSDKRLVYSTDPKDQKIINPEKKTYNEGFDLSKVTLIFKLEKSGRGGKTVTILEGFPKNEAALAVFCKDLKGRVGSGGTFFISEKGGVIEIQGDKRDVLKKILDSKSIKYKGM